MESLLLIPGVLCNETLWEDFVKRNKNNFNIYHSKIPKQLTIKTMTQEVLIQSPKEFWAVGFSLGGWIALQAAYLAPERIKGLILISTTDGKILDSARISMQQAIHGMQNGNFNHYVDQSASLYLTPEHCHNAVIKNKLKKMMEEVGPETAIIQYGALLKMEKAFPFLNKITCPTLIVRGHEDKRNTIDMTYSLKNNIPHAKLVVIENSAHFVPFEQPVALAAAMEEFLAVYK
jgi:pimeloyl-ACP methyl ester carboxylesterase